MWFCVHWVFFFSSRRRHTRCSRDWSSDVCSSDLIPEGEKAASLNPPQAECCIPAPPVLEFDTNGKFLQAWGDRKSTRLNSSHGYISYAVFCLKKKNRNRFRPRSGSAAIRISVAVL